MQTIQLRADGRQHSGYRHDLQLSRRKYLRSFITHASAACLLLADGVCALSGFASDRFWSAARWAVRINWRLIAAFVVNFTLWGGAAALLWSATS